MRPSQNDTAGELAKKCSAALNNVAFPDLATRQLFEGLIKKSQPSSMEQTAQALGEQKLI